MTTRPTGPTGTLARELVDAHKTIDEKQAMIELLAEQNSRLKDEVEVWRAKFIKHLEDSKCHRPLT